MPKITYPSSSAYFPTPQLSWRIGRYVYRDIPAASSDILITLPAKYTNRPDTLSYDYYNTIDYWWIFQVRNMNVIRDPIWDLVAGIKIYIPTITTLKSLGL